MILGVGVDLLAVERIARYLEDGDAFFQRAYTSAERREAAGRPDQALYYAGRFAGKEAVFKCLGTLPEEFRWNEIEILSGPWGAPEVHLDGTCSTRAKEMGVRTIHLSLTSDTAFAAAFAVAEGDETDGFHGPGVS